MRCLCSRQRAWLSQTAKGTPPDKGLPLQMRPSIYAPQRSTPSGGICEKERLKRPSSQEQLETATPHRLRTRLSARSRCLVRFGRQVSRLAWHLSARWRLENMPLRNTCCTMPSTWDPTVSGAFFPFYDLRDHFL